MSAQAAFVDNTTQLYSQLYVLRDNVTGAQVLDYVSYGVDPANPAQSIFRLAYGAVPPAAFTVSPSLQTAQLSLTTPPEMFTIEDGVTYSARMHGTLPGATAANALGVLSDTESKVWTREFSVAPLP